MDRKVKSFRVRVDLLEWIESYAKSRGDTQITVLEAALDSFRGLTRGGVPDLPQVAPEAPQARVGAPAGYVPPDPEVAAARAERARNIAARQQALNTAKERASR